MLFNSVYKRNISRFWYYIDDIISIANESCAERPDCKPFLQGQIDRVVANSKEQIAQWDDNTDVRIFAYKVLYNVAFDALSSGELHLYRGELNPLLPGDKLIHIVVMCLDYYVANGICTKEQSEEQYSILLENIASVG